MSLAHAGGAADEQWVVGPGRHLGDGEGGGVGEAVGVADHELVERELGVREGTARRPRDRWGARVCVWWRAVWVARGRRELDLDRAAEGARGASAEQASIARGHPALCLGRGLHREPICGEVVRAQGLQPDAVDVLVDGGGELGLDA